LKWGDSVREKVAHLLTARRMIPAKIAGDAGMPNDERITTLTDGGRLKRTNQELTDWVFVTAQIERNRVVYSVVVTNTENPPSQFEDELQKE
jgi:hypothetical protein